MKRWLFLVIAGIVLLFGAGLLFRQMVEIRPPVVVEEFIPSPKVLEFGDTLRAIPGGWLKRNPHGLWEMYLQGTDLERGTAHGALAVQLVQKQEEAFIAQIRKLIPSDRYLKLLRWGIAWFNRNLDKHIPIEFQREIYAVSRYASESFNFIGKPYDRMLNYHAAHDIGHALQEYALVGCTSFAVWGKESEDTSLLIGRNFDFYVGDAFAEDKIVCFIKPDKGHPFMMVTWGGMTGVVSGMNLEGLTVTLNAGRSKPPLSSATPISLLAREILQYASTIEEAFSIAQTRTTFVAEALLIGSAKEGRAAVIEKTPTQIALFDPAAAPLICSNHFQSETFAADPLNIEQQESPDSPYRFARAKELINQHSPLNPERAAAILRNPFGLNDAPIGLGNPMAINQMIAHHAIIFQPEKRKVWVSTAPWQLGPYLCYDLSAIFAKEADSLPFMPVFEPINGLEADTLITVSQLAGLKNYRALKAKLSAISDVENKVMLADSLTLLNPDFYEAWQIAGEIYLEAGLCEKAIEHFARAGNLPIPYKAEQKAIEKLANKAAQHCQ